MGVAIFICFTVLFFILRGIINSSQNSSSPQSNNAGGRRYRFQGKSSKITSLLQAKFMFFRQLSTKEQQAFVERVIEFIHTSIFIPEKNVSMNSDMVCLISAAFVQLTLGMDKKILRYFNYIRVFPEKYLSKQTGLYHSGEVNITGTIVLSWKDFLKGYEDASDGFNVGLHEMAHALSIEILKDKHEYPDLWVKMQQIYLRARHEISHKMPKNNFLRTYAFTNVHEYFAVATESFFERPIQMKEAYFELFNEMSAFYYPQSKNTHFSQEFHRA